MMNGTLPANLTQRGGTYDGAQTIPQNQTATQEAANCSATRPAELTAVASGIAVPLGVLLLASLVAVAVLLRQNRSLKKVSRQGPLTGGMDVSQLKTSHGKVDGDKGQGHTGYSSSPLNEMSDGRIPIEAGGRSVLQELPARSLGS